MSKVKYVKSLQIKPTSEFILVRVDSVVEEEGTRGGIIIPTGALANKKTQTGVVVAVGEGRRDPNDMSSRVPIDVAVGDLVLFACFIGYPVMVPVDGTYEEHVIIKHNDVMGQVTEDAEFLEPAQLPLRLHDNPSFQ